MWRAWQYSAASRDILESFIAWRQPENIVDIIRRYNNVMIRQSNLDDLVLLVWEVVETFK
jgi:hypothetical protein